MRYLPLSDTDREDMLARIGVPGIEDLFTDVPGDALLRWPVHDLPGHLPEMTVERQMAAFARQNRTASEGPFFLGAGAYKHHIPASVDHLIQRSEFLTTYTPYQPEIAQGTLQALFEFQTQVSELLGLPVANASMYDGASAAGEAALMAARVTKRSKLIVSGGVHPHYRATIETLCRAQGLEVVVCPVAVDDEAAVCAHIDGDTAGVIVQSPNVFGVVTDLCPIAEAAHAAGALAVSTFTEVVSFGLIDPPGAYGMDIAAGEGQSLGNPLGYGGPYVGLFACADKFVRSMPGRLAGETVDADGKRGFVLTLSTREQHIRREKATSNICTNAGLCSLAFTIHMTLLGGAGLRTMAEVCHQRTQDLLAALRHVPGVTINHDRVFNEFAFFTTRDARFVIDALAAKGVLGGVAFARLDPAAGLPNLILTCATECTTANDINAYVAALQEILA